MALGFANIISSAKKYRDDAEVVIGKNELRRFLSLTAVAAIFETGSKNIGPPVSAILEWIALGLGSIGFVYLLTGFFVHFAAPSTKPVMPLQGLISGFIAGAVTSVIGGAVYYGLNIQGCPTAGAIIKFMRLLPNCLIIGSVLGSFFGSFPPIPASASTGGAHHRRSTNIAASRVTDLIVFLIIIVMIILVMIWVDAAPGRLFGEQIAGAPQGNIVFWQYVIIISVYAFAFLLLVKLRFRWNVRHSSRREILCNTVIRSVALLGTYILDTTNAEM